MCRTVRITTICPRCMNPYMTRKIEDVETLTISEPETIICSYAFETRQICESATTDTYNDGTKHLIPQFDRLGKDFCGSCVSRLGLRIRIMPAPLQGGGSQPTPYWHVAPQLETMVPTEIPQKASWPTAPSMTVCRPVNRGCPGFGTNPKFWIDLLNGNHIMAMPNRKRRRHAKAGKGKGKEKGKTSAKTKKNVEIARTAIRKMNRKFSQKTNRKARLARLRAADKRSGRDGLRDVTASEQFILSSVGKLVKTCIDRKMRENMMGTQASIPRKTKQMKKV